MNRFAEVTKEGIYKKKSAVKTDDEKSKKAGAKLGHIVMIATRVSLVHGAHTILAKGTTIAVRYSAVRHQVFSLPHSKFLGL